MPCLLECYATPLITGSIHIFIYSYKYFLPNVKPIVVANDYYFYATLKCEKLF